MFCEKCGKNHATTHIKTVINGVVKEYNLCGHCAAAVGYTNISHNSLAGMLASMLGESARLHSPEKRKICEVCGSSFSDIAEKGKMGCAQCYKTFNSEILPYLKRVHGSVEHAGKVPNKAPLMVVPETQTVETLRNELNRLVREEKYEQAAVVRDKIKELEGEK